MRTWFPVAVTLVLGLGFGSMEAQAQRGGGAGAAGAAGGEAPQRRAANMTTIERPIEMIDNVWTEQLTTLEVRDKLRAGMTNILVLTGGVEQNGPFLPTGKHNYVLAATGEAIARKMGNTLIAPIITYEPGNPATQRTPGYTVVSQETYRAMLRDIMTSLRTQGFTNIFIMGDSGGNQGGMEAVANELNEAWKGEGARVHYIEPYYREDIWSCEFLKSQLQIVQQPDNCSATRDLYHDDVHYTSIVATVNPEHIRPNQRIAAGQFSINGIDLKNVYNVLQIGRALIDYRADITVRAMRAAMGAATGGR
jgi:creatinine amidohydrolase/Fe(II)-dependent formamide hydrolase-like protein